jgi:hypothetical protein
MRRPYGRTKQNSLLFGVGSDGRTPVHARQRIVSTNLLGVRLGSRLGADCGSNRKPIDSLDLDHASETHAPAMPYQKR